MLYNIIQIFLFQALFLLVYDLFLKRETFFNHNRAYLLITSILSIALPFIKLPELNSLAVKDVVIQLPEVFIGEKVPTAYEVSIAEQAGIILEQPQTPIWQKIALIGIVLATSYFLFKIVKLLWLKHKNPKRWKGNILIVSLLKSTAAFSFFNTIFLGERIPKSEMKTIYKHELVHIEEYHTLDLLFFELLRIIFWFNPLVYIYQNRIKELHEYIADAKAVKQNGRAEYYQSLLNQVFDVNQVSFTNTFFKKSLIKKRIIMLRKSKSKQLHLIKYLLLLPLVFAMLIYSSTEVKAQDTVELKQVVDQELTDEQLKEKLYKELLKMKEDGASFSEILSFVMPNREKYISSRTEYLRFMTYSDYLLNQSIERKTENGTLSAHDIERAEKMTSRKHKNYLEYREWKKTDEAKQLWELGTQDGILKLVVNDLGNQTVEEQKRFDGLMKQLETDNYFRKVVVCDINGSSRLVIDSPNNSHPDAQDTLQVVESIEVPFSVIDEVPTLKECVDLLTNDERKKCMSNFVSKHVNKNFNTGLADSLGIIGRQRIFVSFKIDKQGLLKDIRARASHPAFEEEAKRVIKTLPQFIPGRQKGELVVVPYSLPIVFQIAGDEDDIKTPNYEKFMDSLSRRKFRLIKELTEQRNRILQNSSQKNPVVVNLNKQIDSLLKERQKLLNKYLEQRDKTSESITTVLINRNDQLLINAKRGDLKDLEEILQALSVDKKHLVRILYDKAATKSAIDNVVKYVEKFPFATIEQEIAGPLPVQKNEKDNLQEVPFSVIDVAPTHPDCKTITSSEERKKCTSAAVAKFVNSKFNTKLAEKLGLPDGPQRIFAAFTIGKDGFVKNIKIRAAHPALEEETERVIKLFPQFMPGEHKGEKVDVPFSLPIYFQIANSKKKN
jgi:bla regulator protein blaR1